MTDNKTLVIDSPYTDPYMNLALEDWYFRHLDWDAENINRILLFYRNTPSLIIGRFQNPWRECNIALAQEKGVPIIRRFSGGGTVYHDLGNLNYCLMARSGDLDKEQNMQDLISVLTDNFGITSLRTSSRHDLKMAEKKVSGSAFKNIKGRSYHHGTLLIATDLERLDSLLSSPWYQYIEGKGVHSIRSSVVNLAIDQEQFKEKLVQKKIGCHYWSKNYNPNLEETAQQLRSFAWNYGECPEFFLRFKNTSPPLSFRINHGRLVGIEVTDSSFFIHPELWQPLLGLNWQEQTIIPALAGLANDNESYREELSTLLALIRKLFAER